MGLIGTLLVAIALQVGSLDRIEAVAVDLRHKLIPTVSDSGELCLIAVDDNSLAAVQQWPWPRSYVAGIIELVAELGGRQLLIDFTYTRPQVRQGRDSESVNAEDAMLAQALHTQGGAVLAFYFGAGAAFPQAVEAIKSEMDLTPRELAARSSLPLEQVRANFATIRRMAARGLAVETLQADPALTLDQLLQKLLVDQWLRQTDWRRELEDAYHYARAYLTIRAKSGLTLSGDILSPAVYRPSDHSPMQVPVAALASAARDAGFVDYSTQTDLDGKLRKLSLLSVHDNVIYRQLALATVSQHLGLPLHLGEDRIQLGPAEDGGPVRTIPLGSDGRLIVNWYYRQTGRWLKWPDRWQHSFDNQIPAAKLLDVAFNRDALDQNRFLLDSAADLSVQQFLPTQYERYGKLKQRRQWLQDSCPIDARADTQPATHPATQPATAAATQPTLSLADDIRLELARTQDEIAQIEKRAAETLEMSYEDLASLAPNEMSEEEQHVINLYRCVFEPETVRRINADIEASIESALAELRPRIEDKIVLFGYTATTLADTVATPVFDEHPCPGVIVLANIINQVLEDSYLYESDRNTNLLVVLAMGMVVTILTASQRSAGQGLLWMLILLAAYAAVSFVLVFGRWHIISNVTGPMAAMFISWSLVTLYYQVTEGRTKRLFASRLGQYTNTTLVRRIVAEPRSLTLPPQQQEVTCFFSDLAGFTHLSEPMAPQEVVNLLNIYLEHMSEVLDQQEAFINKFQGDGIFAFFNPPLNPQPDHARRACLAAIECQKYLPHVEEHLRTIGFDLPGSMKMRIGISSGPAVIGDCGSARKFDYTCLGDTVNLASRLETANKFFGTLTMISQETHSRMGEGLPARLLGKIRVVGREKPVVVYELIHWADQADPRELSAFIEGFGRMIHHYWQAEFSQASALADQLRQTPLGQKDQPLRIYRELLTTPELHRAGVIELETK